MIRNNVQGIADLFQVNLIIIYPHFFWNLNALGTRFVFYANGFETHNFLFAV